MEEENKSKNFVDAVSKIIGDALCVVGSVKTEAEASIKHKLERYISQMDFVPREEFSVMQESFNKIKQEHEALVARVVKLETVKNAKK